MDSLTIITAVEVHQNDAVIVVMESPIIFSSLKIFLQKRVLEKKNQILYEPLQTRI
jgi:hypothetical protein